MDDGVFLSQPKNVTNLLKRFKTEYCKPCVTSYWSGVKLTKECDSIKVDATLYK
jgi:RNase P subunit RPR2